MAKWVRISRAVGRTAASDFVNPSTGEVIILGGEVIPRLLTQTLIDISLSGGMWQGAYHRHDLIMVES